MEKEHLDYLERLRTIITTAYQVAQPQLMTYIPDEVGFGLNREVNLIIKNVQGNRPDGAPMPPADQLLMFERALDRAGEILAESRKASRAIAAAQSIVAEPEPSEAAAAFAHEWKEVARRSRGIIHITIPHISFLPVITALQLALRCSEWKGASKEIVRSFTEQVVSRIGLDSPHVAAELAKGFDPAPAAPAEPTTPAAGSGEVST